MIKKLKITKVLIFFSFLIICCNIYPIDELDPILIDELDPILIEKIVNFHKERNAEALEKIEKKRNLLVEKDKKIQDIVTQLITLQHELFTQKISLTEFDKSITDLSSKTKDLKKDWLLIEHEVDIAICDCASTIIQHCLSENTKPFTKTDCSKIIPAATLTMTVLTSDM